MDTIICYRPWNITDFGKGYVAKFFANKDFMDQFPVKTVGAKRHTEWWVPAEQLEESNENIVGAIEIIGEYE